MKRKNRKPPRKHRIQSKRRARINRIEKNSRKQGRVSRKKLVRTTRRQAITDPRVVRALGLMRREGVSASGAARRERIKLDTFRKRAGRYLYRSRPGKPWKARSEDELAVSMTVTTDDGPVEAIVRNSRERKLLHRHEVAIRMFRAGDPKEKAALKALKGRKVAGYTLVTDPKRLIELEEAGLLDFDALYTSVGGRS